MIFVLEPLGFTKNKGNKTQSRIRTNGSSSKDSSGFLRSLVNYIGIGAGRTKKVANSVSSAVAPIFTLWKTAY